MDFPPLPEDALRQRLKLPLPGRDAHLTMAPRHRPGIAGTIPPDQSHESAVLILLTPPRALIPLIERTHDGGPHSGQVALPGGRRDRADTTIVDTALREAHEEIGLRRENCRVAGTLTPLHIDVSGFIVTPVVAWYAPEEPAGQTGPESFRRNPREVERIVMVDPAALAASRSVEEVTARGFRFSVPAFRMENTVIWGATAMILAEFCAIWEDLASPRT